jgi:hypothetical protein
VENVSHKFYHCLIWEHFIQMHWCRPLILNALTPLAQSYGQTQWSVHITDNQWNTCIWFVVNKAPDDRLKENWKALCHLHSVQLQMVKLYINNYDTWQHYKGHWRFKFRHARSFNAKWVRWNSCSVKLTTHSPPSSRGIKNLWIFTSTPSIHLHSVTLGHRDNLLLQQWKW